MKFLHSIAIIVLLLIAISHFKVNSVSIGKKILDKQQLLMINERRVGIEPENIKNSLGKKSKLAQELSNTSLPSFLKNLYLNSSYLRGLSHSPEGHKIITQTIRSYKNQAKSKLLTCYIMGLYILYGICAASHAHTHTYIASNRP